jgi:hypothetical protein
MLPGFPVLFGSNADKVFALADPEMIIPIVRAIKINKLT